MKKFTNLIISAVIISLGLTGCVVTTIHPRPVRTYSASYDAVWDATVAYLDNNEDPIVIADKEKGVITTDWVIYKVWGARRYYYSIQIAKTGDNEVALEVESPQQEYAMGDWEDMLPTERRSDRLFSSIAKFVRSGASSVSQQEGSVVNFNKNVAKRPLNKRQRGIVRGN